VRIHRPAGPNRTLATVVPLYVAALLLWELLRHTPLAHEGPFALLDLFGLWLYAPLPALALLAARRRDWRAGAWLIVPLLALGWEYEALGRPARAPGEGTPLRVMTANLLAPNPQTAEVATALRASAPDLIALQELDGPMAAHLGDALRDLYPHQALFPEDDSPLGMGVLSRHPIRAAPLPEMAPRHCFCQEVVVDIGGQTVTVLNVHIQPTPDLRLVRLELLPRFLRLSIPTGLDTRDQQPSLTAALQRVETRPPPRLVLGDFNVADRQPYYRVLRELLHDAQREAGAGLGYTYPTSPLGRLPLPPLVRIDYVFHDDAFQARAAWTEPLPGSDHRAVLADLLLEPPTNPGQ
jgi:endonuclease/exonuclease/phosphatase (EEP) superfamily protein YafD